MSQLIARRANHAYGMDAMYVAEILLEGAAVRLRPWNESPSQRDPCIARIL
jgi:hypothetical protein